MSPAREGSFNANFSPETLNSFKTLCKDQSRQYTKVLERLAELYLNTNGRILTQIGESLAPETSKRDRDLGELRQSIEQLETMTSIDREDNNETRYQLQELESRIKAIENYIREFKILKVGNRGLKELVEVIKINCLKVTALHLLHQAFELCVKSSTGKK